MAVFNADFSAFFCALRPFRIAPAQIQYTSVIKQNQWKTSERSNRFLKMRLNIPKQLIVNISCFFVLPVIGIGNTNIADNLNFLHGIKKAFNLIKRKTRNGHPNGLHQQINLFLRGITLIEPPQQYPRTQNKPLRNHISRIGHFFKLCNFLKPFLYPLRYITRNNFFSQGFHFQLMLAE